MASQPTATRISQPTAVGIAAEPVAAIHANQQFTGLRWRLGGVGLTLAAVNCFAWGWALAAFHHAPALLGTGLIAYGLGLRHAVDADHIAAIDNVTRKLMQDGKRPVTTGLFFALGHSTIVVLASALLAVTAGRFSTSFETLRNVGGLAGTLISAFVMLVVAAMNIVILSSVWRSFQALKSGAPFIEEDVSVLLAGQGVLTRLFRPMFRLVNQSWHMYPLGFLFGLGFDTATEVGLLGISASQAATGSSVWSILVFPALFAAGMALVDTADGILMLGTYGWAFVKPARKLTYNMVITALSALVALAVGMTEVLGLAESRLRPDGLFWRVVAALNDNLTWIGTAIVTLFLVTWITATLMSDRRQG